MRLPLPPLLSCRSPGNSSPGRGRRRVWWRWWQHDLGCVSLGCVRRTLVRHLGHHPSMSIHHRSLHIYIRKLRIVGHSRNGGDSGSRGGYRYVHLEFFVVGIRVGQFVLLKGLLRGFFNLKMC
jgi:hypothetical protein